MLAETVDDLIGILRTEVNDSVEGQLWSTAELMTLATEACDALARDLKSLYEVISIPFDANATSVALPQRVLDIRFGKFVTINCAARQVNTNDFDEGAYTFTRDYETGRLVFSVPPSMADTLELQCAVTLTYPLESGDDLPFQEARDQRLLLTYMKWRAYEKHDAETESLVRAKRYEGQYLSSIEDRKQEIRNQRRSPGTVRFSWG